MALSIEFATIPRRKAAYRPIAERLRDSCDVAVPRRAADAQQQASRCGNCFSAFCHWACPVSNDIPDFNRLLSMNRWREAYDILQRRNNFPEFTGRLCPALCEASCVMAGAGWGAVTNRENELDLVEHAFRSGWVTPQPPRQRSGKRVAVIGSGPAGLACADQLNKAGHLVVVFEQDARAGGLLRYGIPDFKLEKWVIDRRLEKLQAEGILVRTGVSVGQNYPAAAILDRADAVCLAVGSRAPRDLAVEGRSLRGIHMAMDYLSQANRRLAGESIKGEPITAWGKRVVVLGGGDTGADCVGTALRQGAKDVLQLEVLPEPPKTRQPGDLWPDWPQVLRTSSSHEEGGRREWSVQTKRFVGADGRVTGLSSVRGSSAFEVGADLVILAMGFVGTGSDKLLDIFRVRQDARRHIASDAQHCTSAPRVFAAGDARRGPSLIAWAIHEGREAAAHIDRFLAATPSDR